jgi:inhibitor of KinA sporulation pathway (predicted exonuclease)
MDCEWKGATFPFSKRHLNIKRLHWLLWMKAQGREMGLSTALGTFGLEFEGKQHAAGDDAYNAAKVLALLIRCCSDGRELWKSNLI